MKPLYMLTHLTGEKSKTDRTAVIQGIEIRRRTLVVSIAGFIASAPLAIMVLILWGAQGLIIFPLGIIVFNVLFNMYRQDGLRLRHWQHARDKYWSANAKDQFTLCFLPLDERSSRWKKTLPCSEPVAAVSTERGRKIAGDNEFDLTDIEGF